MQMCWSHFSEKSSFFQNIIFLVHGKSFNCSQLVSATRCQKELLRSIGSLSLYSIPSRIGLYIYIFHVAAFVLANGFDIFSCLISAPRRPGKFRTTILGQSWRHIKLAEYSTAFPSTAATTHFAAMSPPEILMHTQSNTSIEEN